MAKKLTESERETHLTERLNSGWSMVEGRDAITKTFQFADFNEAFGFMSRAALKAEEKCHHPEWFNVWNRVEVTWSTHDAGGLSMLDMEMAEWMDKVGSGS